MAVLLKKKNMISKYLLSIAFLLFAGALAAQINWLSMEEALELQKKQPKKILIDVYTHWCGPCKRLKETTFVHPKLVEYVNEHFYAVAFDAEQADSLVFKGVTYKNPDYKPNVQGRNGVHQFSRFLGVGAYPTIVFMDEKGIIIDKMVGFRSAPECEPYLKYVGDDIYKTFDTVDKKASWVGAFKVTWN